MKRRHLLLFAGSVLVLCLVTGYARADTDSDNRALLNRLIELEGQVRDLSQKSYGQGYAPGAVTSSSSANSTNSMINGDLSAPDVETRLSSLETQLRNLTGQVERANYQNQQTNATLQKLSSDTDFRLQQLEQHQVAMAPNNNLTVAGGAAPIAGTPDANAPITNIAPAPGGVIANTAALPTPAVNADAPATPEELYNRAYSEMQRKEYQTALADFKNFLTTNPASKLVPNAEYWLGEIYYAQGNYKMASATFADGYQKEPKGAKAPDNLLKLGLSLEQQNRSKDACTVMRQLIKDYPSAPDTITSSATRGLKRLKCL